MKTSLVAAILWLALAWALSNDGYFPIKKKTGDEGITAFEARWYGTALERMKEPKLPALTKGPSTVIYRLLILPNYSNPIAVRVNKHGTIYRVSARRLDGRGGYDPGKLVESREVELSADDSKTLDGVIRDLNFLQLATDDDVMIMDGDEWVLEGVSEGKYHLIQRGDAYSYRTAQRGLRAFHDLAKFLLDRCKLSPESIRNAVKDYDRKGVCTDLREIIRQGQ